jgi:hypothetical protein
MDQEVAGVRYVISYDLMKSGADYQPLYDALISIGAKQILLSQWIVRWNSTNAATIHAFIRRFLDPDDRLLVSSLDSKDWAGSNLVLGPDTV